MDEILIADVITSIIGKVLEESMASGFSVFCKAQARLRLTCHLFERGVKEAIAVSSVTWRGPEVAAGVDEKIVIDYYDEWFYTPGLLDQLQRIFTTPCMAIYISFSSEMLFSHHGTDNNIYRAFEKMHLKLPWKSDGRNKSKQVCCLFQKY